MCNLPIGKDWEKLGLLWWAEILLSKTLIQLSADGWGCTPSLIVVWPEAPSLSGLYGNLHRLLMAISKRVYAKGDLSGCCCLCLHPCGELLLTQTSTGDPLTLVGGFGSVSCGATASLFLVLIQVRFCLCPPRLESLFPPVLWKSCS